MYKKYCVDLFNYDVVIVVTTWCYWPLIMFIISYNNTKIKFCQLLYIEYSNKILIMTDIRRKIAEKLILIILVIIILMPLAKWYRILWLQIFSRMTDQAENSYNRWYYANNIVSVDFLYKGFIWNWRKTKNFRLFQKLMRSIKLGNGSFWPRCN